MRELHSDAFYRLSIDESGILHLVRSATKADDLAAFRGTLENLHQAIRSELQGRRGRGLLMDTRQAMARNDEAFESLTASYRRRLHDSFERLAILMSSEVGRLHMSRLSREDGATYQAFVDEAEAVAFLRETAPLSEQPMLDELG